jgi:hypothetical protein
MEELGCEIRTARSGIEALERRESLAVNASNY